MTFYHISQKKMRENSTVLKMNNYNLIQKTENLLESILEKNKPEDKISRQHSLFVIDDISDYHADNEYIYEVNIVSSENNKSDSAWISEMQVELDNGNYEAANECAKKYWLGEATKNPVWEYRTHMMNVVKEIDKISYNI